MTEEAKIAITHEPVDLAALVEQVAEHDQRIILTQEGQPRAALVSMEEYEQLPSQKELNEQNGKLSWNEWWERSKKLHEAILADRGGQPIDQEVIERALRESREDLDKRATLHGNY